MTHHEIGGVIVHCMYYLQCMYFVYFQLCEECEFHYLRLRCVLSQEKIFVLSACNISVCVVLVPDFAGSRSCICVFVFVN